MPAVTSVGKTIHLQRGGTKKPGVSGSEIAHPVSTGSRAAAFTRYDGDGRREAGARWHAALHRDDAGLQHTEHSGHEGGGRGRTSTASGERG